MEWTPKEPSDPGIRLRAAYEAVAYLIALAVKEHEAAGQIITRITVSGGIAKSEMMCEILAAVIDRRIERLVSSQGTALGAAVVALAGYESYLRNREGMAEPFSAADAVATMVKFKDAVEPKPDLAAIYSKGLERFRAKINS